VHVRDQLVDLSVDGENHVEIECVGLDVAYMCHDSVQWSVVVAVMNIPSQ
jgi:hypothetical protein